MPVRTEVDLNACEGHSLCSWTAPEVFQPDEEDGHAVVQLAVIPAELEESVRLAAANCPESAITIIED